MPRTIALPDPLISRLESQARSQHTTIDALVVTILDRAVHRPEFNTNWSKLNARRMALIHQRFASGLNPSEVAELQQLLEQADQQVESLDAEMLRDVPALHEFANQVLSQPDSLDCGMPSMFEYPSRLHVRRHGPRGYRNYRSYKPWLRDDSSRLARSCCERSLC